MGEYFVVFRILGDLMDFPHVKNEASHSHDYFEQQILHHLDIRVRLHNKNIPIINPW